MAPVAAAVSFVWLGMVLGISFLEAPLKFRAPGSRRSSGSGSAGSSSGRCTGWRPRCWPSSPSRSCSVGQGDAALLGTSAALAALLTGQLLVVGRRLNRRSDRVLAGEALPRSREHHVFVALEVAKVVLLVVAGVAALG